VLTFSRKFFCAVCSVVWVLCMFVSGLRSCVVSSRCVYIYIYISLCVCVCL
jgi:hypothetical protein